MKILMLGDSITHGYTTGGGVTPYTLASTIASETGNDVINGGINGTEVFAGDDSFTTEVEQHNFADYDMVMIMYGSNDIGREGETIDDFKRGYQQGIDKILSDNPKIDLRLITMIPDYRHDNGNEDWKNKLGLSQRMVNDAVKEIAQKNGGKVFDWRANGIITSADQLLPDHLHPTDATYQAMGKALANWIKDDSPQPQPSDNTDILSAIYQYKYLYFGFDPAGENSSNLWKATPALCGSNDAIDWTLIAEFPQLGNLRDGNIAKYNDYYWITGTTGLYRTKDFQTFKSFDVSFLQRDGYTDIWAPEFFTDYSDNWHLVWGAVSDSRHVYVADFDPETGEVTNSWQMVNEDHGIDPHIWKMNGKYYLSIDAYWLYEADSYMGPYTLIKNNIEHSDENGKTIWYEAGETLVDGDTIYFYCDHITGSVSGVADSGQMVVQTANIHDLSKWTGPQNVTSSINMRHGSFLKVESGSDATITQVSLTHIDKPFDLGINTKHNYEQCLSAINTIYNRFGKLLGDDVGAKPDHLQLRSSGLDRNAWLYIVHVFDQLELEINKAVGVFRSNGFANIRTRQDFDYIELVRPLNLMIDTSYQTTLNNNWDQVQTTLNDLLAVLTKFHV